MELFHYVHCPFCVRVRMALGYLNIPYTSTVLHYDDEATPLKLTNKKMLPIFKLGDGYMNESLDIIKALDSDDLLQSKNISNELMANAEKFIDEISNDVHSLAMPYWVWTPEFDEKSRKYFIAKKAVKRGPFNQLAQNRNSFETKLINKLEIFSQDLKPFFISKQLTILDIMIASHLWGLYIVPEFQMPAQVNTYLQNIKKNCHFNYHEDFWK